MAGCGDDGGGDPDTGMPPVGMPDGGVDSGTPGGGIDAGAPDAGPDAGIDATIPDGPRLTVLSASPEPGSAEVAPGVAITVTFSEDIDPGSVDGSSFQVLDGRHGATVLGEASVDGAELRFVPAAELTLRERYEIVIGVGVTDVSGTSLEEEWRGDFTVRDGVLDAATPVLGGVVPVWAVDMGERGEAFALWWGEGLVLSRQYQAASGWGDVALILATGEPERMTVATGLEDAALGVWEAGSAREAVSYAGGTTPWVETPMPGGGGAAQVGIDGDGAGLAAWLEDEGTNVGVRASRFDGAAWGDSVRLDENVADASSLHLAVDHAGNGVALWAQDDQVWTARFRDDVWEAAAPIEVGGSPAIEPLLVMDGDGRGMAVWIQHDGTEYRLRWSRHEPESGWSAPAFADGGPAIDANRGRWLGAFAFNSHGDAVAMWNENFPCGPPEAGETCNELHAGQFSLELGWQASEAISDAYTQFGFLEFMAAIDRHGSVLAAWTVNAGLTGIELWLRRYVPDQGWEEATPGACADGNGFGELRLSSTPQGRVLAAWSQETSERTNVHCAQVLD